MIRPLGILGLVILVLQGCSDLSWLKWPLGATEAAPVPGRKPSDVGSKAGDEQQALAGTGTEAQQTSPVIGELVGLDFGAVRAMLGDPALEEIQPPATVWAYNGRGCVLSIFFYPDVDGGSYRALTYQVKGAEQTEELPQRCFNELLRDEEKMETN